MNLDELRSVRDQERAKDSLQHLRDSFYEDVADFISSLKKERKRTAEQADDPFGSDEVYRLTNEIDTAEETIEAIYQRRVGKIVKLASFKASDMPADEEGLTSEEQKLFAELVERIESNKQEVLDVLAGDETPTDVTTTATDTPTAATDAAAESAPAPGEPPTSGDVPAPSDAPGSSGDSDVSAADVMGGGGSEKTASTTGSASVSDSAGPSSGAPASGPTEASDAATDSDEDARPMDEAAVVADAGPPEDADPSEGADPSGGASAADGESASGEADSSADDETGLLAGLDERTTVRVTDDVGEIFGVDERTYDLESEDVVTLPEANAEPLVERGAAEKLE